MPTPTLPPPPVSLEEGQKAASAHADAMISDAALARAKGELPQQVEARKRVAKMFCEQHLPGDTKEQRDARLAGIDYAFPLVSTNARGIDVNGTKKGFLGMGRKKSYLISVAYPPTKPEEPIYALEYVAAKR